MKKVFSILLCIVFLMSFSSVMASAKDSEVKDIVLRSNIEYLFIFPLEYYDMDTKAFGYDPFYIDGYSSVEKFSILIHDDKTGTNTPPAKSETWIRPNTHYYIKVDIIPTPGYYFPDEFGLSSVGTKYEHQYKIVNVERVDNAHASIYLDMHEAVYEPLLAVGNEGIINDCGTFKYAQTEDVINGILEIREQSAIYSTPKQKGYSITKTGDTLSDTYTLTIDNLDLSKATSGITCQVLGKCKIIVKGDNKIGTDLTEGGIQVGILTITTQPDFEIIFEDGASLQIGTEPKDIENENAYTVYYGISDGSLCQNNLSISGKGDLTIYDLSVGIDAMKDINIDLDGCVKIVDYGFDDEPDPNCCIRSILGDITLKTGSFDLVSVTSKIFSALSGKITLAQKKLTSSKDPEGNLGDDTATNVLSNLGSIHHITLGYRHKVKFDTNGGDDLDDERKDELSGLPIPKRDGFEFGGWYIDKGLTKRVVLGTEVTDDMTLYAKWTKITKPVPDDDKPASSSEKSPNTGDASAIFFGALALAGVAVACKKRSK